jgi:hypothetical protein
MMRRSPKQKDHQNLAIAEDSLCMKDKQRPAEAARYEFLRIPECAHIVGDEIHWTWPTAGQNRVEPPHPFLWKKFAALSYGSTDKILRFAQRWGPLKRDSQRETERLEDWRSWSQRIAAAARLGGAISSNETGKAKDWKTILRALDRLCLLPSVTESDQSMLRRSLLVQAINSFCETIGPLSLLRLEGSAGQAFVVRPTANSGALGAVVLQLIYVLAQYDEQTKCSECGAKIPSYRPKQAGRRRYCKHCRQKGIPKRDAARAYRERRRVEKKLFGGPKIES